MKTFFHDGHKWRVSKCGEFVSMFFHEDNEWSGWHCLAMFDAETKSAAKTAR